MDKHKLLAYMIDWLIDVELASSAVAPEMMMRSALY
jgi:hypothetical protein